MRFFIALIMFVCVSATPARVSAAELLMMEAAACEWCEKWDEEIGVVYGKTKEGRRAPLKRLDIHDPMPAAYSQIRRANFSPTFILVDNGEEIGRIRGYPGEDFFWPMLHQLLAKLPSDELRTPDVLPDTSQQPVSKRQEP